MAVVENVHPDYKQKAQDSVIKCLHEHKGKLLHINFCLPALFLLILIFLHTVSADKMDPKDPKCGGYADLKQCIQDNVSEVCGEPPIFRRRR